MDSVEHHPPDWLEVLEHTADEGIAVRAEDKKELFARFVKSRDIGSWLVIQPLKNGDNKL